ncbi:UDP-2,3-diacylglucosamine diphosphatase [Carboxylicivirga sp. N1Y90]|uniref:UDP-2,3-diacylglucosamine diphosphatase n=1 Tax=Carboxylicivirga fragile TaxID=3417571 RepID=UPI003D331107|nr:UDP-2,3-diacylglucosamine diphosphatase [Marinilabiliaceae bacterium N1Y90]
MSQKNIENLKKIEALVISDVHLGTFGCKAKELVSYLKTVDPKTIVLNGDIVDVWQFSTSYFPKPHLKVIRQLLKMMENGSKIYYIVGNHDENLRRFIGLTLGKIEIANKVVLNLNNTKTWIFHGDVFDVVMHHSKWLAKLGANGYGILTLTNRFVNGVLSLFGKRRISLSRDVKKAVKGKSKNITTRFESTVADLAIKKEYDYAICGHIHWPEKKLIKTQNGEVSYLNSGDWVENMTALEYHNEDWHLVYFKPEMKTNNESIAANDELLVPNEKTMLKAMLNDIIHN